MRGKSEGTLETSASAGSSPRRSNIELLRIVSMFAIVACHFINRSVLNAQDETSTLNGVWSYLLLLFGKSGVNLFVLISGYFLVVRRAFNANKVVQIIACAFFYSMLFFAVFTASGAQPFSIKELVWHAAPITFCRWWFVSAYFILYILSPYINISLRALSRRQYLVLLTVLTILWCVIPTITGVLPESAGRYYQSDRPLWFVFLYSVGGYVRLFGTPEKLRRPVGNWILVAFTCLASLFFACVSIKIKRVYDIQTVPPFVISLLIFLVFSEMRLAYNKTINLISSATFGVYLIHDHDYVRVFLWETLFHGKTYSESVLLIPYSLFVATVVFAGCAALELARIHWFGKYFAFLSERIVAAIKKVAHKILP